MRVWTGGVLLLVMWAAASSALAGSWKALEPGLEYQHFTEINRAGSTVHIRALRLDPQKFDLVLLNASNLEDAPLSSVRKWSERFGLLAAINASMYQEDHRTSVSLMKTRTHNNNSYVSKDQSVLAFDPLADDIPLIKLIDRQCDDFDAWRQRYGSLVQSIRMISCKGKNVWSQQSRKSSIAALGIDADDRVLLLHMSTPQSTHDFINMLQELPLELERAMYLEGSAPAQMAITHPALQLEAAGSWCSDTAKEGERAFALPIPNVLGVVRRDAKSDD